MVGRKLPKNGQGKKVEVVDLRSILATISRKANAPPVPSFWHKSCHSVTPTKLHSTQKNQHKSAGTKVAHKMLVSFYTVRAFRVLIRSRNSYISVNVPKTRIHLTHKTHRPKYSEQRENASHRYDYKLFSDNILTSRLWKLPKINELILQKILASFELAKIHES